MTDVTEPILEIKGLSRIYGMGEVKVKALNKVSFDIKRGEFVAIMGKSGSGKSTLLHQLGLLDMPDSGEIIFHGNNISGLPESRKAKFRLSKFGYVFQEYALLPELTALENVYLPAMALGRKKEEYMKAGTEALDQVGLGTRLHHRPREMSGGEQQRVAIARALINKPDILFADEPTANLDSASSKQIIELFQKLNRETGLTILMVTHEPDDMKYVSTVVWLKDGELAERGT
ncbi:MAG: ABC transporter ATP-binding protein [Candidatus Methanoperedens sp.]|nr:ABC transporter ATP-binding protein [Candidatus Methanoperedens sp.]MCZ7404122.1 ABC transporter ATP-binding protein [Candidatus Methanoperedens sp.]